MPVRKPEVKQGLWRINGKRQVIYALSSLRFREQLAAAEELARLTEVDNIPF
jgi:hypothetical protein